jgi:threonine dehydratase
MDTPLVRLSNLFPERSVYAKCEFLAPSGCFKIRGAVHLIGHLKAKGASRQLVVPSMGNTALGTAVAAREFGFAMVGVVPRSIGRAKDEKLQALGVELVKIDGGGTALLRQARQIAADRGAYFVHPHLDPLWTDGYRSMLREILQALPSCRSLVFPVGGGGLLMGLTAYLQEHPAPLELVGCEAFNSPTYAAFDHPRSATIADGLILEDPHAEVRQRIDTLGIGIHLVSDADIRQAMADLFTKQGWIVEPSSAITAALVSARKGELAEPVCIILTGENIGRDDFYRQIGSGAR